jgi:hypothetical protein
VRSALFGAGEVWYTPARAGKARYVFRLQQTPDGLSDFLLGHGRMNNAVLRETVFAQSR